MPGKYVLAIDAGSSGGRALIFDLRGALISSAGREWTYDVPEDAGPMGKELIPVHTREGAETFKHDHTGHTILTFEQVTSDMLPDN